MISKSVHRHGELPKGCEVVFKWKKNGPLVALIGTIKEYETKKIGDDEARYVHIINVHDGRDNRSHDRLVWASSIIKPTKKWSKNNG